MVQAIAIRGPLSRLSLGPKRSTSRPPNGTTKNVSVAIAIVNVHCNAVVPQPYFWAMGLMNSVQPYCRMAIATRQTMPKAS